VEAHKRAQDATRRQERLERAFESAYHDATGLDQSAPLACEPPHVTLVAADSDLDGDDDDNDFGGQDAVLGQNSSVWGNRGIGAGVSSRPTVVVERSMPTGAALRGWQGATTGSASNGVAKARFAPVRLETVECVALRLSCCTFALDVAVCFNIVHRAYESLLTLWHSTQTCLIVRTNIFSRIASLRSLAHQGTAVRLAWKATLSLEGETRWVRRIARPRVVSWRRRPCPLAKGSIWCSHRSMFRNPPRPPRLARRSGTSGLERVGLRITRARHGSHRHRVAPTTASTSLQSLR
jgi:hypothetical protein